MTSEIHLEAIWRARQGELFREIRKHAEEWNKYQMCQCIPKEPEELIVCEHILEDRKKKYGKRIKKQFKDANLISSLALGKLLY